MLHKLHDGRQGRPYTWSNRICSIKRILHHLWQSPIERFSDIFDQASYIAEHMAKDHIFEDGNKRTSLVFAFAIVMVRNVSVNFSDNQNPEDNPYYEWIQDLAAYFRIWPISDVADLIDQL